MPNKYTITKKNGEFSLFVSKPLDHGKLKASLYVRMPSGNYQTSFPTKEAANDALEAHKLISIPNYATKLRYQSEAQFG